MVQVATIWANIQSEFTNLNSTTAVSLEDAMQNYMRAAVQTLVTGNVRAVSQCVGGASNLKIVLKAGVATYGGANCVLWTKVPAVNAYKAWIGWALHLDTTACGN
jgi:hypothetical protein